MTIAAVAPSQGTVDVGTGLDGDTYGTSVMSHADRGQASDQASR
jgi:hypothetical protein